MRRTGWIRLVGGTVVAAALTAGCSFSADVGTGRGAAMDRDDVAREAAAVLEQEVGRTPDDFTCPEDLPAEVDASIRCELIGDGVAFGVTVTTTSVDGENIEFDVQVDDAPAG